MPPPDSYSQLSLKVGADGRVVVPEVFVTRAAPAQSIPSGAGITRVNWNNVLTDNDGMFDPAQPDRVTVRTPGLWAIVCQGAWVPGFIPAGTDVSYAIEGTVFLAQDERNYSGQAGMATVTAFARLTAGQFISFSLVQQSGVARDTFNDSLHAYWVAQI